MFDKRLLELVPEARKFVVLSVLGKWVALAAYALFVVALARLLESMVLGTLGEAELARWGALSLAAIAVRAVCLAGAQYAGSKAAALGKAKVRADVYDKLVSLGPSYKEQVSTSQAAQLCGEGAEKLEVYLGQYLPQLFYAVLAPVTLFALFLTIDAPIAVVLLVCVPLIPVSIVMIMKFAKRVMGAYWGSYVDLGATFLESISALTTLKLFQADERKQREIDEQAEGFRKATMRLLRMQLNSVTVMDLFTFGGAAVGIVIALFHVQAGQLSLAGALTVVLLGIEFFMPMRVLGSFFHTAMGAAPVLDQVFDLLALKPIQQGTMEVDAEEIEIEFHNVGYRYSDSQALQNVSFIVEKNTFVGITGESGSGKSTLACILCGELAGYQGSILVNGVELRDVSPACFMPLSRMSRRARTSSRAHSALTSCWRTPMRTITSCGGPWGVATWTTSYLSSVALMPKLRRVAPTFPAVSASAWPLPAPFCAIPLSTCSTRPPRTLMPTASARSWRAFSSFPSRKPWW